MPGLTTFVDAGTSGREEMAEAGNYAPPHGPVAAVGNRVIHGSRCPNCLLYSALSLVTGMTILTLLLRRKRGPY